MYKHIKFIKNNVTFKQKNKKANGQMEIAKITVSYCIRDNLRNMIKPSKAKLLIDYSHLGPLKINGKTRLFKHFPP